MTRFQSRHIIILALVAFLSASIIPSASALTTIGFKYTNYPDFYDNALFQFPTLTYVNNSITQTLTLKNYVQNVTVDINSPWSVTSPLFGAYQDFWSANQTSGIVTANTTITIDYTRYPKCSGSDDENFRSGCIGSSTESVFGDSLGYQWLGVAIGAIVWVAFYARFSDVFISTIMFLMVLVITVAIIPQSVMQMLMVAIVVSLTAIISRILRRTGT